MSRRSGKDRKYKPYDAPLPPMSPHDYAYHVRRCRYKTGYPSEAAAYAAARVFRRKYGSRYSVYHCQICGKYHLTTHPWRKDGN